MNDLVKTLLNHEYINPNMKKQKYIYKRTRKNRIKDKVFMRLFIEFMRERPATMTRDFVLLRIDMYNELVKQIEELGKELQEAK